MMLCCIWRRRNNKVWETEQLPVRQAVQMVQNLLLQWRAAHKQPQISEQQRNDQLYVQWQPPTEGYVKCNIDAT